MSFPTAESAPVLEDVGERVETGTLVDCDSVTFPTADSSPRFDVVVDSPGKVAELVVVATGFDPLFCCRLSLSAFSSLKNFSLSTR